jgi:AcrR family transcriptional regulator
MPSRTRLQPEQRRAQLIDVAARLFARGSYEHVSLEEIAVAASCSRQLVYHYFPAKRELLLALVAATSQGLIAATEPPVGLAPLDQLSVVLDAALEFVTSYGDHYRVMQRAALSGDSEISAVVEATFDTQTARMLASVPIEARTPAVALAARAWLSFLRAVSLDWIDGGRLIPPETVRSICTATLLGAVAAAGVSADVLQSAVSG